MSKKLTLADFKPDDFVTYVPYHARGLLDHEDCEYGIVTSVNDHYVFVRFGTRTASQACKPDQLVRK